MIDLSSVAVLIGPDGKPTAVQVDIVTWRNIVTALEDAEDIALAQQVLAELDVAGGPKAAGWVKLADLASLWQGDS